MQVIKSDRMNSGVEARVEALLQRMTLEEKVGQMTQYDFGYYDINSAVSEEGRQTYEALIERGVLGSVFNIKDVHAANHLQRLAVENSRLGIPLLIGRDVIHGYRTITPIPLAQVSSWNPQLVKEAFSVASEEALADGIKWVFAPMIDVTRDPRWGRIAEGPGEDTYLAEVMSAAMVQGAEIRDNAGQRRVISCPKHFAAYGASESGKDYNAVDISDRTLRELYLPPFKSALDAGAMTIMTAFNTINGVPACANPYLLRKILREEWGYKGFVVSDYRAVAELLAHGLASSEEEACLQSIRSGLDMDMDSGIYQKHLPELVRSGRVSEESVDTAVRRILTVKFMLGLFDDPYTDTEKREQVLQSRDHRRVALEMSRQSAVLLKNSNKLLPLKKTVDSIAVIGPLADNQADLMGCWAFDGDPADVTTVLEGISAKVGPSTNIVYARGCELETATEHEFAEAVHAAENADVAVLVVGEGAHMSGEAHSRSSLQLPGVQESLVQAVHATGTPTVVVLMNGRPLTINWLDVNIPAILEAWHLGVESGTAIADILFGDCNPSGKLPVSFPRSVGQVPIYYNHLNTGRPPGGQGHAANYLDIDVTPLYPFGHGLSYTEFQYSNLRVQPSSLTVDGDLTIEATISNTGDASGEEVVQLYVRDVAASVARPIKQLKGFQRVWLQPGEQKAVVFTLREEDLRFYDAEMIYRSEPGEFQIWVGPNSVSGLQGCFVM